MVDIVSGAVSARAIRRVAAAFRLRPSSLLNEPRVEAADPATPRERQEDDDFVRVCLEVQEDKESGDVVYRLVELGSGAIICEWRGDQVADLRKFLSDNHIQLIDKRV
jgi:hypothetical protein